MPCLIAAHRRWDADTGNDVSWQPPRRRHASQPDHNYAAESVPDRVQHTGQATTIRKTQSESTGYKEEPSLKAVRLRSVTMCDNRDMPKPAWQSHWHKHPGVRSGEQLTLGERSADRMRNMMGSWPFVFSFFAIMIAWALINTLLFEHILHHQAFDPYPYILLNLFLSMLAGVQAAALLIAAKRADAISSEVALHTANNTDDIKTLIQENTVLTSRVKMNTDLLEEIHLHVANIGRKVGAEMGHFAPSEKPPEPESIR
jgi:uncharacterized membrane protein